MLTNINSKITFEARKYNLTKKIPEWAGLHEVNHVIDPIPDKHPCLRENAIVQILMSFLYEMCYLHWILLSVEKNQECRKPFLSFSKFHIHISKIEINIWIFTLNLTLYLLKFRCIISRVFHENETTVFSFLFIIIQKYMSPYLESTLKDYYEEDLKW